jgi:hypothetical protein
MTVNIVMPDVSLSFPVDIFRTQYEALQKKGVYFLYGRDGLLLYVGQTKNFYTRLNQHLAGRDHSDRFNTDINFIDLYFVEDDYLREIYETYAIHTFKPVYNVSKVFEKERTDRDVEIDELISELRSERSDLVGENIRIQEDFDDTIAYEQGDLEFDDMYSWGVLLKNRERISVIDAEIRELNKKRLDSSQIS